VRSGSDNVIDITLLGFTVSANFMSYLKYLPPAMIAYGLLAKSHSRASITPKRSLKPTRWAVVGHAGPV
jgi:hypothetical protein